MVAYIFFDLKTAIAHRHDLYRYARAEMKIKFRRNHTLTILILLQLKRVPLQHSRATYQIPYQENSNCLLIYSMGQSSTQSYLKASIKPCAVALLGYPKINLLPVFIQKPLGSFWRKRKQI